MLEKKRWREEAEGRERKREGEKRAKQRETFL